jgi:hypothetical protein
MTDSPAEPEKPPFEAPPVARAVISVCALLGLAALWSKAMAMPERAGGIGYLLGALTLAVVAPLTLVWLLTRRDPGNRHAQPAMIVVAVFILLSNVAASLRTDLPDPVAAFRAAAKQAEVLRTGDDPRAYEKAVERTIDAFVVMARHDGRPSFNHLADTVQSLTLKLSAYRTRADAFMDGIDRPADLDSVAKIDARLEQQRLADVEGTILIAAYKDLPATVEAGLQGPDRDEMLAAFMRGYERRTTVSLQIIESELRTMDGYRRMLTVLRDNFGRWGHHTEHGLVFADDFPEAARDEFDAALAALTKENAELERLDALFRAP